MKLENRFTTYSEKLFVDFSECFTPYLSQVNLPCTTTSDPRIEISCDQHMQLFEIVANNNKTNFGLSLGTEVKPEHFGLFGHVFKNAANVKEYLDFLVDYKIIYSQGINFSWQLNDGLIELSYPITSSSVIIRQHVEFVFSSIVKTLSMYIGSPVKIKSIHFVHEQPENIGLHNSIFGNAVYFAQPMNKVFLDADILKIQSPDADFQLLQAILPFVNEKKIIRDCNELSVRLRYIFTQELHTGNVTIQKVSSRLGISVRTLQRELSKYQLSFSQILTDVRQQLTLDYLNKENYSIFDISQMLGFKEISSFSRAFRRWNGVSPNEYRRNPTHKKNLVLIE